MSRGAIQGPGLRLPIFQSMPMIPPLVVEVIVILPELSIVWASSQCRTWFLTLVLRVYLYLASEAKRVLMSMTTSSQPKGIPQPEAVEKTLGEYVRTSLETLFYAKREMLGARF